MNTPPQQVMKLVLDRGACPVDEWLASIRDRPVRARIMQRIDRLERGNFGDHAMVGKGFVELRLHFGPGFRVYFGRTGETIVVLLGGGVKSTQDRDIRNAQALWEQFEKRGPEPKSTAAW